jgi:hypothetical protein
MEFPKDGVPLVRRDAQAGAMMLELPLPEVFQLVV